MNPRTVHVTTWKCVEPFMYVRAVIEGNRDLVGVTTDYSVWFEWRDTRTTLDRPRTHGINAGFDIRLARRLAVATEIGLVHSRPEIRTDVDGNTYVHAECAVMGKYLRADLDHIGAPTLEPVR